ncbi:energy transducer TonB [Lysobacter firmicutimachus]|uniref:Energy transducer TonB n=1 Tax=Lysobacter firmicutimachus TaxID=1792846 RepID=A0AAU8MQK2_9GAMM
MTAIQSFEPAAPAAGSERDAAEAPAAYASSSTGLWLLLILLGGAFMGWYYYGKRPVARPPAPAMPLVVLPPIDRPGEAAPLDEHGTPARLAVRRVGPMSPTQSAAANAALPALAVVTAARPLFDRSPEPDYPPTALRRGEGGTVVVRIEVGADGVPGEVGLARRSGSRELDRAALTAVRDWRFRPATRDGTEVASVVEQPVEFRPRQ